MPEGFQVDTLSPSNISTVAADFGAEMIDFDDTTHDAARVYFEIDTTNTFPDPTELDNSVDVGLFSQNTQSSNRSQGLQADTDYFVRAQAKNIVFSDDTLFTQTDADSQGFISDLSETQSAMTDLTTSQNATSKVMNNLNSRTKILGSNFVLDTLWDNQPGGKAFINAGSTILSGSYSSSNSSITFSTDTPDGAGVSLLFDVSGTGNNVFEWSLDFDLSNYSTLNFKTKQSGYSNVELRTGITGTNEINISGNHGWTSRTIDISNFSGANSLEFSSEMFAQEVVYSTLSDGSLYQNTSSVGNVTSGLIDIGRDGNIYSYSDFNTTVRRFDSSINETLSFSVSQGGVNGVDTTDDGDIYVINDLSTVYKYNSSGVEQWSNSLNNQPVGVKTFEDDSVFVITDSGSVTTFNSDGTQKWTGSISFGPPSNNEGVVRSADNRIFTATNGDAAIFEQDGTKTSFPYSGSAGILENVAFDTTNEFMFIANRDDQIEKWDSSGNNVFTSSTIGVGISSMYYAETNELLYVVDADGVIYEMDGSSGAFSQYITSVSDFTSVRVGKSAGDSEFLFSDVELQ